MSEQRTWAVQIRAEVTKTIIVEASTEQEAIEEAHSAFTVASTDEPEDYGEITVSVQELPAQAERAEGER